MVDHDAPVSVVVVDRHVVLRSGLASMLSRSPHLVVTGHRGLRQGSDLPLRELPKVSLVDVTTLGESGVDLLLTRPPATRLIATSLARDHVSARIAADAGAVGCLVHGTFSEEQLVSCVLSVAGRLAPSRDTMAILRGGLPGRSNRRSPQLSPRQMAVMELLVRGHDEKSVASSLDLSERTVRRHVVAIQAALGVDTASGACAVWSSAVDPGTRRQRGDLGRNHQRYPCVMPVMRRGA